MKKVKIFFAIMLVALFSIVNLSALFTPAHANMPSNNEVTFMAGSWITQGGVVVGCKCPRLKGPCVCQIENAK